MPINYGVGNGRHTPAKHEDVSAAANTASTRPLRQAMAAASATVATPATYEGSR